MSNVITHPRFNRPQVHQPHPRRRKGTINFRHRSAWIRMRRAEPVPIGRPSVQAQEMASRKGMRRVLQEDARKADMLPVYLANDLASLRIMHALRGLGIELDFNGNRNAFVLRAPHAPGAA